jgi:hypothetical protein
VAEDQFTLPSRNATVWAYTNAVAVADSATATIDLGPVPPSIETDFSAIASVESSRPLIETFELPTVNVAGVWQRLQHEFGYRDGEIDAVAIYTNFLSDIILTGYGVCDARESRRGRRVAVLEHATAEDDDAHAHELDLGRADDRVGDADPAPRARPPLALLLRYPGKRAERARGESARLSPGAVGGDAGRVRRRLVADGRLALLRQPQRHVHHAAVVASFDESPKTFRVLFVVLERDGAPAPSLGTLRSDFEQAFSVATGGRGRAVTTATVPTGRQRAVRK